MSIVLRLQKGSVLSFQEMDNNFVNLDTRVQSLESSSGSSSGIPYEADTGNDLQWVEGTYDFGNNIIKYANVIQAESELANYSPATYHGMTMHVHETGALYFAHAGVWRKLLTDNADGDAANAGYVDSLSTVAYEGDLGSLTDVVTQDVSDGDVLKYNANAGWFEPGTVSGGGIANIVEDTSPQLGGDLDVNGNSIQYTFNVGNDGASDYTFADSGNHWFPTTENDPVLYLRRGETYVFDVNASGHPFEIRVSNGGSAYNTGVTNNGTQVGLVTFKVPMSAPATLYYQCTAHSVMGNTINIV